MSRLTPSSGSGFLMPHKYIALNVISLQNHSSFSYKYNQVNTIKQTGKIVEQQNMAALT